MSSFIDSTAGVSGKFVRQEAENDREDDFFTIEVGGNVAKVFRPLKDGKRLANYYVKGYVGGVQFFRGTGWGKKGMAAETARKLWKAKLEGRTEALVETKLRSKAPVVSIGKVLGAYESHVAEFSLTIESATVSKNMASLRGVVAYAMGAAMFEPERDKGGRKRVLAAVVDKLSASVLTESLVEKFLANYVAQAGTDRVARDAKIRGAVSMLRQARSVFAKAALKCFRGLVLPELAGFMNASVLKAKAPPQMHLETSVVKEMAVAALALKESQPELYLVHLLARHLGMRPDEIECARAEWLEERAETVWLPKGDECKIAGVMVMKTRSYWEPKASEGAVPISPCVWAEIAELIKGRKGEEFLVKAATATDRAALVDIAHNDFVRPWTDGFRKKAYELRRWAATLVAERQGEEMAERFLRHRSKSVAGKFYLTKTVPPAPVTMADVGLGEDTVTWTTSKCSAISASFLSKNSSASSSVMD